MLKTLENDDYSSMVSVQSADVSSRSSRKKKRSGSLQGTLFLGVMFLITNELCMHYGSGHTAAEWDC